MFTLKSVLSPNLQTIVYEPQNPCRRMVIPGMIYSYLSAVPLCGEAIARARIVFSLIPVYSKQVPVNAFASIEFQSMIDLSALRQSILPDELRSFQTVHKELNSVKLIKRLIARIAGITTRTTHTTHTHIYIAC